MSTLNVANISDDQSTLTGSNDNPIDKLHDNLTVDTKFVTNGCAKAWIYANSSALVYSSLNISSSTYDSTGTETFSFFNDFSDSNYATVSGIGRATDVNTTQTGKSATSFTVKIFDGSNSSLLNGSPNVVVFGDLA